MRDLGRCLVSRGALSDEALDQTMWRIARHRVRLPDALRVLADVPAAEIAAAEAQCLGTSLVDPLVTPPDVRLVDRLGPETCLRTGLLPLRVAGGCTLVATSRPDELPRHMDRLRALFGPVRIVVAEEDRLQAAVALCARRALTERAEHRVRDSESSRGWRGGGNAALLLALCLAVMAGLVAAPAATLVAVLSVTTLFMVLSTGLKVAAAVAALRQGPPGPGEGVVTAVRPTVSILVPLFREREIAAHLLARLIRLDYPQELLDIILVLEADDLTTRAALSRTALPRWVRTVTVPPGGLKTKPRALNYALDFARGEIVGIYDAEDAPDPDQIARVVATFAERGPDVACLQGVLDYYNTRSNWFTRCFTIEYAAWFRVLLPGLSRLGLVVPLGGTTLFLRREALDRLGGWDAHNVTEDADLGIRLARYGYRTELIDTVTHEEANGRLLPWIRQRSRWLKGYAMTYAVHMRSPRALWRDLGPWRFFGIQVLFLGTVLQFALAPVLWACWVLLAGAEPVGGLPKSLALTLTAVFLLAEAVNLAINVMAARRSGRPWLGWWAPTLIVYFPLATAAMYKALWELFSRPFYWDKTEHGVFLPQDPTEAPAPASQATPQPRRPRHPVAAE